MGGTRQESSEARRAGRSKKAIHKRTTATESIPRFCPEPNGAQGSVSVGIRTCNFRWLVVVVAVVEFK